MSASAPAGGFSLFPSTGRPPSRTQGQRPRAPTPQQQHGNIQGAVSPDGTTASPQQQQHQYPSAIGEAVTAETRIEQSHRHGEHTATATAAAVPGNDAQHEPPVRSSSVRSRSSIAKMRLSTYDDGPPPFDDPPPPMPGTGEYPNTQPQQHTLPSQQAQQAPSQSQQPQQQQQRPPALRSIFPQYNPEVSLDQQDYFPTQTSPTRIPRAVISRPLYSPVSPATQQTTQPFPAPQQQQLQQYHHQLRLDTENLNARTPAPPAAVYVPPTHNGAAAGAHHPHRASSVAGTARTAATATTTATAAARSGPVPLLQQHQREAPMLPVPSTTEELRNLWKVSNGWKAGPSEGRVYCLRVSRDDDAPIYRLSSANHQPFYRLRLDPTSASAYVTLLRHDPARPFKSDNKNNTASSGGGGGGGGDDNAGGRTSDDGSGDLGNSSSSVLDMAGSVAGGAGSGAANAAAAAVARANARYDRSKHWQVALTTTLEETARRHAPQDGLVALLYPSAAARMALARPHDAAVVLAAERECTRLVWDDDAAAFFLVHPVLALPFRVAIERSAAWSRTAYTLEHRESPQHLARLTVRHDGTGTGFLEVDTALAAKIDAVYLVDAVVAALVLVAHTDTQQNAPVERFAPPPSSSDGRGLLNAAGAASGQHGLTALVGSPHGSLVNVLLGGNHGGGGGSNGGGNGRSTSRLSFASRHSTAGDGKKAKKAKRANNKKGGSGRHRMDEYDVDLESQTSIDLSSKMYEMGPVSGAAGGGGPQPPTKKKRKGRGGDDDKDKMPGCLRAITMLFKCCFWCVAMCVRALLAIASGLFRCIFREKL